MRKLTGKYKRPFVKYRVAKTLEEYLSARYVPDEKTKCWNCTLSTDKHGYSQVCSLKWTNKYNKSRAHQFAFICWKGPIPTGLCVLHRCDNRICINPDHLFLGTHVDNMKDMVSKDRSKGLRGSDHPNAKLNNIKVLYIRKERVRKKLKDLAKEMNVSASLIYAICSYKVWKHVN